MSKKRPPIQFNDEQLLLQASNVADIYHQLALDLFDNVVERVTERGTVYLDKQPYIWQLEKMQQMHMLNEENLKLISERSGVAEEQLRYIVENEGLKLYTDTKQQLMEDLGRGSLGGNNYIQEILADYADQAIDELHNLINTTLPRSVIGAYQGIVEQSVARVVTGLSTADKAISDTVMKWQEKGFQGFKDSAGRNWKIDNYARTVIKTTTYRTFREMRTRPAEELGIDTFYFSKKASARKYCAPLQHHIVTTGHARTEHGEHILALSDYGYGRPEGCLGINCGHMLTPFIPGANYKPDLGEGVAEVSPEQAEENANAEAKQRALERSIRANKEKLHVAEKLGDDDLINKYKSKIGTQKAALKDYIDKHLFLKRNEAREKLFKKNEKPASVEPAGNKSYVSVKDKWLSNADPSKAKVSEMNFWEHNGTRYEVDNKNVIFKPTQREKEVGKLLADTLGRHVVHVPEVHNPNFVKTPDYLIDGVRWDLKEIEKTGKNNIDNAIAGKKEQARSFIIDVSKTIMGIDEAYSKINRIYFNKHRNWVENIILIKGDKIIDILKRK
nr:MAG TPA: minor capsid protein [Caudoviricetes sp.]